MAGRPKLYDSAAERVAASRTALAKKGSKRIDVTLTPEAADSLEMLKAKHKLTTTEVVCQALTGELNVRKKEAKNA